MSGWRCTVKTTTRLSEELLASVRHAGGLTARARCFAGERPLPLAPVSEWLRSDACQPGLDRLEPAWRTEVTRLLPELGTDSGTREPGDSWQRHRFFEGLVRAVLAVNQPIMLLLDDLQWCDLDTLTWLELCLRLGADAPLLMVTTARSEELNDNPELVATLSRLRAAGMVMDVELDPLLEAETTELATLLLGSGMDSSRAAALHKLTEGFPLFVVEAVSHGRDSTDIPALGSPRVQAVLEGRLGQLSDNGRELAGLSAAIGRDFSPDLLIEASGQGAERVVDALDALWRRQIVREYSAAPYDFSHDLLRAAAYDSLSPPQRRGLHRRVAQALVRTHADTIDTIAAHIAAQYDRARMPASAVPFYLQAAQAARRMFAYQEAVLLSERALTLLAGLPAGSRRDEQELQIRVISAGPLNALGGWTSPEARRNVEQIRDLSERTGDRPALVESLVALWGMAFVRGTLTDALALAGRALTISGDNVDLAAYAHTAMAGSLTSAGDPREALRHFDLATMPRGSTDREILGFAPNVMAWAWGAHACWLTGRVGEARERAATAVHVAEGLGAPFGRTVAVAYAAITHQLRRDRDETLARVREVRELSARYEFAYYQHWADILEGRLRSGIDGIALIEDGIRRLREHDVGSRLPYYLALLAETLFDAGQTREAANVLAEAHEEAEKHADWWWLPELWRLEARLHPGADGDDTLERAMTIAGEHGSTSLGLRAAVDLTVRLARRGAIDRARELVTPLRSACVGTSPELEAIDAQLSELLD
jgi:tetratricopeptide (TPR) repeat protein